MTSVPLRFIAPLFLLCTAVLADENPFVVRFGGPHLKVDQEFRKRMTEYGGMWAALIGTLGKDGLKDVKGFDEFVKSDVQPKLDALKPKTPEEEKLKLAATYLKTIVESQVVPSRFKPEEIALIEKFMKDSVPNGERAGDGGKIGFPIIQFRLYLIGLTVDEFKKQQENQQK
jgi:hypothetical protein